MKAFEPEITRINDRTVLAVTSVGDPNKTAEPFMKALYGTAYGTKMKVFKPKGKKMSVGPLSAFWPDAHLKSKDKWTGNWKLEISDFVKESDLLQKNPEIKIYFEKIKGGEVAQILHLGPYSEEGPTVKKLHEFIDESGYELSGPHEEIYLTRPNAKEQKTIIRYVVKKR